MKIIRRWQKRLDNCMSVKGNGCTKKRALQGSYTVEAVFLFPILVLLLAFILSFSIDWYEAVRQESEDVEVLQEMDNLSLFLSESVLSDAD